MLPFECPQTCIKQLNEVLSDEEKKLFSFFPPSMAPRLRYWGFWENVKVCRAYWKKTVLKPTYLHTGQDIWTSGMWYLQYTKFNILHASCESYSKPRFINIIGGSPTCKEVVTCKRFFQCSFLSKIHWKWIFVATVFPSSTLWWEANYLINVKSCITWKWSNPPQSPACQIYNIISDKFWTSFL